MEKILRNNIIEEILEIFEDEKCFVKFPISKNEYGLRQLYGSELRKLKKSNLKTVITKLIEIAISKVETDDKNKFLKENSHLDYFELLKKILECSYREHEVDNIECGACGYKYDDKIKIEYSQYKNENKEWDKDIPFNEYEILYEFKIERPKNAKQFEKIKIKLVMKIPTMEKFVRFINSSLKDIDVNAPLEIAPLISVPDDQLKLFVEKIIVEGYKSSNDMAPAENYEFNLPHEINKFISTLPIYYKQKAINKIIEELKDYIPIYTTEIECKNCGEKIKLILNPQIEFLSKIFNI